MCALRYTEYVKPVKLYPHYTRYLKVLIIKSTTELWDLQMWDVSHNITIYNIYWLLNSICKQRLTIHIC